MAATGQKHLLLEVPDYDHSGGGAKAPRTYLQLGAYPTAGDTACRGDDLLDRIGLTEGTAHFFKDDFRHRNGQQHPATKYWRDDGHQLTASDPVSLTRQLRTRGGWRLHTDGNYVSTTRGDRVDVIGGNYKMAILGRLDAPGGWGESYYESSGGHNRDATNTPGEMIMVAWNPATQTWRTVQETIKGDVVASYQGIVREHYECDLMLAFTGSATEGAPIPASGGDGPHTHTDFTTAWVQGAPPRPMMNPSITETVRALTITDETTVQTTGGMNVATDTGMILHPIADRTINETASYRVCNEWTAATTIDETITVDSGAVVSERVGVGPPPGSPPGTPPVAPVPLFRDTLLAGAVLSTATYRDKTVANAGELTRKFNAYGVFFELGTELTFDQVLPEFGRHEIGVSATALKLGASITGSLALTLGLKLAFKGVNGYHKAASPNNDHHYKEWKACLWRRQYLVGSRQRAVLRLHRVTLLAQT